MSLLKQQLVFERRDAECGNVGVSLGEDQVVDLFLDPRWAIK